MTDLAVHVGADAQAKREVLLALSYIPVTAAGSGFETLDLWARDLNAQAQMVDIILICPIGEGEQGNLASLDPSIRVVNIEEPLDRLESMMASVTFLQIPGNSGWRQSRPLRTLVKMAKKAGVPSFLGVSSNRAMTNIINNKAGSPLRRLKSYVDYAGIRLSQRYLARQCHGVFVVGAGLVPLVARDNDNVLVAIASWISRKDFYRGEKPPSDRLRLCMAGRLEVMKGFHLGLEAIAQLGDDLPVDIAIMGNGPERDNLASQAEKLHLQNVRLLPAVAYPEPFFSFVRGQDIVLLTNLNDEQPRLIFDAISNGTIPVCPNSKPYVDLGLDPRILYERGSVAGIAACLKSLADPDVRAQLLDGLQAFAENFTIETMHADRLTWMRRAVR